MLYQVPNPSVKLIDTGIFAPTAHELTLMPEELRPVLQKVNAPSAKVMDTAQRLIASGAFQANDTDTAYFLARSLESIQAEVLPVIYGDITFRTMFPVDTSTPAGAEVYGYNTSDVAGQAKIINTISKDIPWSSVSRGRVLRQTAWVATKYGYSYGELQSALYTGQPLEADSANSARRALEELLDDLAWDGDTAAGIIGIFNNTDIPSDVVPDGASTDPEWSTKTPDEILADFNKLFTDPYVASQKKEKLDTVGIPVAQWTDIANRRVTDTGITILEYLVQKSVWVNSADNIVAVPRLAGIGTAGADVMIGYTRNPSKIQAKLLQDVTFHPVQQKDLNFEVIVTAKSGGTKLPYPVSFYILEGI